MGVVEYSYVSLEGGPRLVIALNRAGMDVKVQLGVGDRFLALTVVTREGGAEHSILPLSDSRVTEWLAAVSEAGYIIVEIWFPYGNSVGVIQRREDVGGELSAALKELSGAVGFKGAS